MTKLQVAYTTSLQRKEFFEEAYVLASVRYGALDDFTMHEMKKYIIGDKELDDVEQAVYHRYEAYGEMERHEMPLWDNSLKIFNKKILTKLNAAIATIGIMKMDAMSVAELDIEYYRTVHRCIFGGLYPWAGEIRDIDITKHVGALQNTSYRFIKPENIWAGLDDLSERIQRVTDRDNIEKALQVVFEKIGIQDWNRMDDREKTAKVVNSIGNIWRIHPFLHGNMLTELYFLVRFCDQIGIPCKRTIFGEYAKDDRLEQCMILAYYDPNGIGRIVYRAVYEKKIQNNNLHERQSWIQVEQGIAERKRAERNHKESLVPPDQRYDLADMVQEPGEQAEEDENED